MFRKYLGRAVSILSVCVFVAAIFVIRHELHKTSISEILSATSLVSGWAMLEAMVLIFCNYLILTGYDMLALRYLQKSIPYPRVALSSFICHAFSNNLGVSLVTGGSMRYRLYSSKGLSGPQVVQFVSFCLLTFWLGFLTLAGLVFLLLPPPMPHHNGFPISLSLLRPLGFLFLGAIVAYVSWNATRKAPVLIRGWTLKLPSTRMTLAQIIVASCEWFIGSYVLFLLLPPHSLPYLHILGLFLVAHLAGLASQVPGGLGVFESVVLALLPVHIPTDVAAASLILYRCVHNVMPLALASICFAAREVVNGSRTLHHKPIVLPDTNAG